ncbi:methyltransferase domain-containing protein [Chlorobaculum sp. MV4-Y]|uniref:class I SAM-dependent methyltransferase n=1 Tax=Chlorobaculum sp. MV4-Y TaxID=2976335 RepID=UPI0021B0418F|nr:methyltransferase domain-containing protein [Chlorobaculum sp. MV4-Y]UWX57448.1 methyltransferase domain-containing protein [Chlorobaculum sp. MV4-Y]
MSADPITIFRKTWGAYQKVISHNLMFHREIATAVATLFESRPGPLHLIDLGCGDASHIVKLFKPGQLEEYCGCDLSQFALDKARKNLEPFGAAVNLCSKDMLSALREAPESHYDIVYSSYALHHPPAESKQAVFSECRHVLRDNGCIILVDVMRDEGQARQEYLYSYNKTVRTQWEALTPDERNQVQEHIRSCDFPETASTLEQLARNAGFSKCQRLEKQTWHEAWCYEV